ncbi:PAT1 homolog 1-like isoform X2 [Babesia caballi]|uniref:PAT1 homolog 1-like isoform X2 n=1 Tax=Babesia caballi TaxID=5871 RepID=A0AAV4M1H9_BABCB|nr:PAT1 homolog 1-like isoform X2 [Babesia caballi]
MRPFHHLRLQRAPVIDEENAVGEILEDIECLRIDGEEADGYDQLNDDTFGGSADHVWDPTETFKEAEKGPVPRRKPREPRELVKSELFDFPEPEVVPRRQRQRSTHQHHQQQHNNNRQGHSNRNNVKSPRQAKNTTDAHADVHRTNLIQSDIESYRALGLYSLNPHFVNLVAEGVAKPHKSWQVSQRTLERHAKGIVRTKENLQRESFMDDHAFDQILRIYLTQVCKDPRLQNYTGKWNTRHMGMRSGQEGDAQGDAADPEEGEKAATEQRNVVNPNRFGKTSSASVRYGRKLIRLNDLVTSAAGGAVGKDRQLRHTIESGYEALYTLCDIEEEIEQCPMNHVAALDKMQKDREEKLNQLFVSLTTGSIGAEDIMGLNKGRKLMINLGRKLSIETKLQLACCMVRCSKALMRMCFEVEKALASEHSLIELIRLLGSAADLRPLVAFDRADSGPHHGKGARLQQRLFAANSYTQCFLFIAESLTLAGHLFLLTAENGGRETALNNCCTILLRWQQVSHAFIHLLSSRGGVVLMNVLLERIRQCPIAVDKGAVDLVLHYTLEVSEHVTGHAEEWRSLASTIMEMYK